MSTIACLFLHGQHYVSFSQASLFDEITIAVTEWH
jgi:hypothetical protein